MNSALLDIVDLGSGVTALVLNRPEKRNAFSVALLTELVSALERLGADAHCRIILLAARGRVFSAGADIADPRVNAVGEPGSSEALLAAAMELIAHVPQPVVARVHGDVYGGAIGLVAAADLIIVQSEARFVFTEAKLGVAPTLAAATVVPRIGQAAALRMALLGDRICGREALEIGLATRCAAPDALDAAVRDILETLIQSSPSGLASCKRLIRDMADTRRRRSTEELFALTRELVASPDAREAASAAAELRLPHWWGAAPETAALAAQLSSSGRVDG